MDKKAIREANIVDLMAEKLIRKRGKTEVKGLRRTAEDYDPERQFRAESDDDITDILLELISSCHFLMETVANGFKKKIDPSYLPDMQRKLNNAASYLKKRGDEPVATEDRTYVDED